MKRILFLGFLIGLTGCSIFPKLQITADKDYEGLVPVKIRDLNLPLVNVGISANDHSGDGLRTAFGKVNAGLTQTNTNSADILLRAPTANASLTGLTTLEQLKIGIDGVVVTSITSDGSSIIFWSGLTQLSAIPGTGSGTWGQISGSLVNQLDLQAALDLKAPVSTTMTTSHAANTVTGQKITNWDLAYGWGSHSTAGYALNSALASYALTSALAGYVPTSRTVNGHDLGSNVSVTKTDLSIQNVDNTSDADKPISTLTQSALDSKQATLVDGVNFSTVGGISLLTGVDIPTGGTGTVTSVGVTTANGVSAAITSPTTAADLTFTLGAITPSSVNGIPISGSGTPTLAVTGTTAVSGTNTGNNAINTLYSGLVTNATHSGDVTGSGALTIASGAVTLAKMANMATASVVYRKTGGTGAPEVQTLATLKTDLGLSNTNTGDQTTISGNAATATKLAATKTINTVAFDGSANITIPSNIAPSTSGNVMTSNGSVWESSGSVQTQIDAIEADLLDTMEFIADDVVMLNGTVIPPLPAGATADTILVYKSYNGVKGIYYALTAAATSYPNFYVSTSGSDIADGLTPATAWRTVSRVNDTTFAPGSNIAFKRGDEWREMLTIPSGGTSSNRMTFSAYGTGSKPIFNAADVKTGWGAKYGPMTNVWGIVDPSSDAGQAVVVINGTWYNQVATLAELTTANTYFVKTASTPDSLYVYSVTNPNSVTSEIGARACGIYGLEKSYVTVKNIDARNACKFGIELVGGISAVLPGYCVVDSCNAYHNRLTGIEFVSNNAYGFTYNTASYNNVTYNGNGIVAWEGVDNAAFSHNYTAYGIHNWLMGGGTNSDGTGIQGYLVDNFIVENNESSNDNTGIYLDPGNAGVYTMTARYNYVHDSPSTPTGGGRSGIGFNPVGTGATMNIYYNLLVNTGGNEVASIHCELANTGQVYIYNNTIYHSSATHLHNLLTFFNGANINIKNNIEYFDCAAEASNNFATLRVPDTGPFVSNYNQYYKGANPAYYFRINLVNYSTLAAWQAVRGQDANSSVGDPLFTAVGTDFTLQAGSPAKNTGTVISGIPQVNILGQAIVGTPNKGCY